MKVSKKLATKSETKSAPKQLLGGFTRLAHVIPNAEVTPALKRMVCGVTRDRASRPARAAQPFIV